MTVLAAICRDGRAWIASDSRACAGTGYRDDAQKLYRLGGAVVGVSGSLYIRRPISQAESAPLNATAEQIEEWCWGLADGLRAWAKERGHGEQGGMSHYQDMALLIASPVGIWRIDGDGCVIQVVRDWEAIGTGGVEARGALALMYQQGMTKSPINMLDSAVMVACSLDTMCGGPIQRESLP